MDIEYERMPDLTPDDYIGLLHRSGLAERRPAADKDELAGCCAMPTWWSLHAMRRPGFWSALRVL